jgi:hypothetical protein
MKTVQLIFSDGTSEVFDGIKDVNIIKITEQIELLRLSFDKVLTYNGNKIRVKDFRLPTDFAKHIEMSAMIFKAIEEKIDFNIKFLHYDS